MITRSVKCNFDNVVTSGNVFHQWWLMRELYITFIVPKTIGPWNFNWSVSNGPVRVMITYALHYIKSLNLLVRKTPVRSVSHGPVRKIDPTLLWALSPECRHILWNFLSNSELMLLIETMYLEGIILRSRSVFVVFSFVCLHTLASCNLALGDLLKLLLLLWNVK